MTGCWFLFVFGVYYLFFYSSLLFYFVFIWILMFKLLLTPSSYANIIINIWSKYSRAFIFLFNKTSEYIHLTSIYCIQRQPSNHRICDMSSMWYLKPLPFVSHFHFLFLFNTRNLLHFYSSFTLLNLLRLFVTTFFSQSYYWWFIVY